MGSLTTPDHAALARSELARQAAIAKIRRPQRGTARAFGPKPVQPKPLPATGRK